MVVACTPAALVLTCPLRPRLPHLLRCCPPQSGGDKLGVLIKATVVSLADSLAVVTIDEVGNITSCNSFASTVFGYSNDALTSMNIAGLMPRRGLTLVSARLRLARPCAFLHAPLRPHLPRAINSHLALFTSSAYPLRAPLFRPYSRFHASYLKRFREGGGGRVVGDNRGRMVSARHKDGRIFQIRLEVHEITEPGASRPLPAPLSAVSLSLL